MLSKQQCELIDSPPAGVRFISNPDDITDIQADIDGPVGTPYERGVFRCVLKLDNNFPVQPPKGYFLTKIFHPNISSHGEICVNTLKKDWDVNKFSLSNIFKVISCLLIVPFPESSLNEEAGRMFMEDYGEYARIAKLYTQVHAKHKESPRGKGSDDEEGQHTPKENNSPNDKRKSGGGPKQQDGLKKYLNSSAH